MVVQTSRILVLSLMLVTYHLSPRRRVSATFFAFFHLLEAFSQSEDVSVLVIMIARMMDDLVVFLKLAIIIILSFTASFVGLEWVGSMDLSDEEPNLQEEMADDFVQSNQTPVHAGDGSIAACHAGGGVWILP